VGGHAHPRHHEAAGRRNVCGGAARARPTPTRNHFAITATASGRSHLDGCVEVAAAYYGAPHGWIGQRVQVQWNDLHVRLIGPKTGQLLREHLRAPRGWHRLHDERSTGTDAGEHGGPPRSREDRRQRTSAPSAIHIHQHEGAAGMRRLLGVLALAKKHGPAVVDDAANSGARTRRADLPLSASLRRTAPASADSQLRQVDPLIRQLTLYRDLVDRKQETAYESRRARSRAPSTSACLGWPPSSKPVYRHAQTEKLTPIDLVSMLVADELLRRQDRLLERRHKLARFRDPERSLDSFDFDSTKKRTGRCSTSWHRPLHCATRGRALSWAHQGRERATLAQAIGRAVIQITRVRVIYREAHTLTTRKSQTPRSMAPARSISRTSPPCRC